MFRSRYRRRLIFVLTALMATRLLIELTVEGDRSNGQPTKGRILRVRNVANFSNASRRELVENGPIANLSKLVVSNETASECYEELIDWKDGTQPKYKMDPNLLLIPSLYNGPNNQLIGFQQSVLVALLLNRTLVLPQFYEHARLGVTYRGLVNAKYRLDVQRLREFISVISLEQAVKTCKGKFDAIFATGSWQRKWNAAKLVKINMEFGLKGVQYIQGVEDSMLDELKRFIYDGETIEDENLLSKKWWPRDRTRTDWIYKVLDAENPTPIPIYPRNTDAAIKLENVRHVYNSQDKCALYWFPFRQFHFKPSDKEMYSSANEIHKLKNVTMNNGVKLYADILRHFQSPPPIRRFSEEFRRKYLNKNYVAIHWRFDEEDFFDYLCKKEARTEFCNSVRTTNNATALSMSILQKLDEVNRKTGTFVTSVYFAAPPSLNKLVTKVKEILHNAKQFRRLATKPNKLRVKPPKVYSAENLEKFLHQSHGNCDWVNGKQLGDTISQVEMDLCSHSVAFLWSKQSTWSGNVFLTRKTMQKPSEPSMDDSITDFTLKVMKQRS